MSETTFSVIIPSYNCVGTLPNAVQSVLCQLGSDDEIVIVDDGSEDNTQEVTRELTESDERIRVIQMGKNSGRSLARCSGVAASKGSRILFLDADDEFKPGLVDRLRSVLKDQAYDVVHFGIEMRVLRDDSWRVDEVAQKWFDPYIGCLYDEAVFNKCFVEQAYQWNLANKCFDGNLCRMACARVPNQSVQRGDDSLLYFVISYFAKSYCGLSDARYYLYNFGAGQDSARTISCDEFAELCKSVDAVTAMETFLQEQGASESYWDGMRGAKKSLVDGCANKLRTQLEPSKKAEGVRVFAAEWGWPAAISALRTVYGDRPDVLAKQLSFDAPPTLAPGDTIATYCNGFSGGGTENVQRMLVSVWRSLGLNVVMLLGSEPDPDEIAELGVAYRVIPAPMDDNCEAHTAAIAQAVVDFGIKGIVYHRWIDRQLFWDLLYTKMQGIPFFIHCHGLFIHYMLFGDPYFGVMPYVFGCADGIMSLSEVDALHWRQFNHRTFVTVNPSQLSTKDTDATKQVHNHKVLWLGRIAPEKMPFDALEVFQRVRTIVPDATMDFVGSVTQDFFVGMERDLVAHAKRLGLEDSVTFTGWSNDLRKYYDNARVFLMTSEPFEGFPLTLGECQATGLPSVAYDLPYLTLVRESTGIQTVEFGNWDAAASAVAKVLTDDEAYTRMRNGALKMAQQIEQFDFCGLWHEVLMTRDAPDIRNDVEAKSIYNTMLFNAYRTSCNVRNGEVEELRRQMDTSNKKLRDITTSWAWKSGKAITAIPRKAKKVAKHIKKLRRSDGTCNR
ncbi:MAG: glycosyltransferase [Coriobacteriales bacterium]|nr:glycosyltransferase [Coriobacteriales bacterium]